jgi:hypothetical protein
MVNDGGRCQEDGGRENQARGLEIGKVATRGPTCVEIDVCPVLEAKLRYALRRADNPRVPDMEERQAFTKGFQCHLLKIPGSVHDSAEYSQNIRRDTRRLVPVRVLRFIRTMTISAIEMKRSQVWVVDLRAFQIPRPANLEKHDFGEIGGSIDEASIRLNIKALDSYDGKLSER